MTPILGMIFTMIADAIEYGQWKTGVRTAGAIQSAATSGQKFGQGIGSALIGGIMAASGYSGELAAQSERALATISNMFIYGVTALGAVMIVVLLFYKLDDKEVMEMDGEIALRKKAAIEKAEADDQAAAE